MKITLNADENLIKRAQQIAKLHGMTLNDAFREWLVQFTSGSAQEVDLPCGGCVISKSVGNLPGTI